MRKIYFQLIGGASGDMLLSSLIDLGCPVSYLKKEFKKLNLKFKIKEEKNREDHFLKKKIFFLGDLDLDYQGIIKLIKKSFLEEEIRKKAIDTYKTTFEVERKIHKIKKNNLKFHHLGKIDAILEICGFFIALKYLKVEEIFVSVFPLDKCSPATLEILKNKKVKIVNTGYETITPTAAILLKNAKQKDFSFSFKKVGWGWGNYSLDDYLVAYLFEDDFCQEIIKIETNIDDMNPKVFESLFDFLYKAGAKEVWIEQVIMKKSRPGFILNVLCSKEDLEKIKTIIFSHTTTFGIRYQTYLRDKLKDKFIYKSTKWGKIKFRISEELKKEIPEYQDCLNIAKKFNIPLLEIYRQIKS
jgi:hypothetical protein